MTEPHDHHWRPVYLGGVVHYFTCSCDVCGYVGVTEDWVGDGPEPEGRWQTLNAQGIYRRMPDGTRRKETKQ